jgi:hypothetical protein
MTIQSNFQPRYGSTQTFSPAAGSATVTVGKDNRTLRVKNTGATNPMFFRTGRASDGTVTATAADMPVYPGEVVYIAKSPEHDTLAHISAAGTTATVTAGEGGAGCAS